MGRRGGSPSNAWVQMVLVHKYILYKNVFVQPFWACFAGAGPCIVVYSNAVVLGPRGMDIHKRAFFTGLLADHFSISKQPKVYINRTWASPNSLTQTY